MASKSSATSSKPARDVEKALLTTNLAAIVAFSAPAVISPGHWHNLVFGEKQPRNQNMNQFWTMAMTTAGAAGQIVANSDDKKAKKNMLKLMGAAWCTGAAMQLNNVRRGEQRREATFAGSGVQAALGATLLWAGFCKD
ncbi:hypothetical protein HYH03_004806 [Edaphochlamys debaryana]|uniref:Uncharacterized protein n=1 Tax=Edaphochlamys debaryana TaxID=47281 RepID=A0A836C2V8_9CHLO|nr:hypothetical protein HYH03_004806 [Edaphochlamys debaryana]|eukprot:KAG2497217.1 hypothetical protein HYH03_004806 [Edaphochlamys debaryana]